MRWRTLPRPFVWASAVRGNHKWGKASAAAPAPRPRRSWRRPGDLGFESLGSDMEGLRGSVEDALGARQQREAVGTGEFLGRTARESALAARLARLGLLRGVRRAAQQ